MREGAACAAVVALLCWAVGTTSGQQLAPLERRQLNNSVGAVAVAVLPGVAFFAGGSDGVESVDGVDIYFAANSSWGNATLSLARTGIAAAAAGGVVYFSGGTNIGASVAYSTTDVYDSATGVWSNTTGEARYGAAAASSGGNNGSRATNAVQWFWPNGTKGLAYLAEHRSGLAAAFSPVTNQVFFGGGFDDNLGVPVAAVEMFYCTPGGLVPAGSVNLSLARDELAAVAVGDLVMFAGGYDTVTAQPVNNVDIYNVSSGVWLPMATLSVARWYLGAGVVLNRYALFIGGLNLTGGASGAIDIFDSETGSWYSSTLQRPRFQHAVAVLNTTVIVAGGKESTYAELTDVEVMTFTPPAAPTTSSVAATGAGTTTGAAASSTGTAIAGSSTGPATTGIHATTASAGRAAPTSSPLLTVTGARIPTTVGVATSGSTTASVSGVSSTGAPEQIKSPQSSRSSGGISPTAIVVIAVLVPAVVILAIAALVVVLVIRRRRQKRRTGGDKDGGDAEMSKPPKMPPAAAITGVEVGERLGAGNFGEVFSGKWQHAKVALKRSKVEDLVTDFANEAAVLSKLNHPHVVRFFGLFVDAKDGCQYIVTEFMSKGGLDSFVRDMKGQLGLVDLSIMALHAAAGCQYLAEQKVVHRDLALRNLLLAEENRKFVVKVADFGLSRVVEENYYKSKGGPMPIKWCAPEVLEFGKFTTQSDVWAFGIILWELFSGGKTPYPGFTNAEASEKVLDGYRMPKPKQCPEEVYHQMKLCWLEEPSQRPSFEGLSAELSKVHKAAKQASPSIMKGIGSDGEDSNESAADNGAKGGVSPTSVPLYNDAPEAAAKDTPEYQRTPAEKVVSPVAGYELTPKT